jgi:hypothetical protein
MKSRRFTNISPIDAPYYRSNLAHGKGGEYLRHRRNVRDGSVISGNARNVQMISGLPRIVLQKSPRRSYRIKTRNN